MKPFTALAVLRVPPEVLSLRIRDRLTEIGQLLDDIESIEERDRRFTDRGIETINHWSARQRIPALLQDRLGNDAISWLDRARWSGDGMLCEWSIEPSIGAGHITCSGLTRFEGAMAGRGVRVYFEGALTISPDFVATFAGPFRGPATALIESIATTLIPKNLRAAAEVAARLA